MQTLKGIVILLLVALAVFTAVGIYNHYSEATYVARLKNKIVAAPAQTAKRAPAAKAPGAGPAGQKTGNASL